jgi:hypothetical protein
MARDNALKMQTSNNIYLFISDFSVKYVINIVKLEPIKASTGEGVCLSQLQNIAKAASPVRNKKEEQEADHSCPL